MSGWTVSWDTKHDEMQLVIIDDFDPSRAFLCPLEANMIAIVNTDAILAIAIYPQCLETVPWRPSQTCQRHRGIQLIQFSSSDRPNLGGALPTCST